MTDIVSVTINIGDRFTVSSVVDIHRNSRLITRFLPEVNGVQVDYQVTERNIKIVKELIQKGKATPGRKQAPNQSKQLESGLSGMSGTANTGTPTDQEEKE